MTWIEALILGVVQGLTEFLPVSSSGHIEIGKVLFDIQAEDNLLFSVVVHAATALSTIIVFRNDLKELILKFFRFQGEAFHFGTKILISIIPVGVIGVFFEEEIEAFFGGQLLFVGFMLLITGSLLSFTYFRKDQDGEISFSKAFIIGLAQAFALLPGISRSGATIATGILLGAEKSKVTRFSFLMVLIPILGATFLKILDLIESPALNAGTTNLPLIVGFIAAFLSGLFACSWMIKIVKRGKLIYFAIYCFILGGVAIITYL